jgi:hypothetical protein
MRHDINFGVAWHGTVNFTLTPDLLFHATE